MSKYEITYSCGHVETKQLYGKTSERESYVEYAGRNRLCSACYAAKLEADRTAANQAAAQANAHVGLPALTGSDKQIAWAESVRKPLIAALDAIPSTVNPTLTPAAQAELSDAIALIVSEVRDQAAARWWIDNRPDYNGNGPLAAIAGRGAARYVADQLASRMAALAPTADAEFAPIREARAAKIKAAEEAKAQADADAKAAREREAAAYRDEQARNVVKANSFRVGDRADTVTFAGKEDFTVRSMDGRAARGSIMDGEWAVYQIGDVHCPSVSSTHPEMERIAREAKAQWARQQEATVANG